MTDKKCLHASAGMEIDTLGNVKPCCLATPFLDSCGNPLNLSSNTLVEIWNSSSRMQLLQDLDDGIENSMCKICWQEEKSGIESKRLRDNTKQVTIDNTPQFLDLKLGNTCNLRCRICNAQNSSSWAEEEYELSRLGMKRSDFFLQYKKTRDIFADDNYDLWNTLEEWVPNAVFIDFYGGEPLLIKKTWELLKKSVEKGSSKNQNLHFNTNATVYLDENKLEILKEFKKVNISLSIDGINERFEYLRYPAKWSTVEENIKKYYDLYVSNENIDLSFCYTINIMNIWDIIEFDEYIKLNYPEASIFYNNLFDPDHFSITNIPENIKQIVQKRLLDYSEDFAGVVNMMENSKFERDSYSKLQTILKKYDSHRNQKFGKYFPEWNKILKADTNE